MTAPRYLLDTDTCSYIYRRRPPNVLARFRRLGPGEAALSVITYGELFFGAERSPTRELALQQLEAFAGAMPILPLSVEAAQSYGIVRASLAAKSEIIDSNNLWIAAHALSAGLTLVTNNEREFRRVDGLRIENWVR